MISGAAVDLVVFGIALWLSYQLMKILIISQMVWPEHQTKIVNSIHLKE